MFAKRGYIGASIGEIAAEAGFSKGALYWNFASKEEFWPVTPYRSQPSPITVR